MSASPRELTALREKLAGLRNDVLDRLCRELGADELELLANSFKRTGARLRDAVDRLSLESARREAILASMADALLIIDAKGRLVRLNKVAREVLCLDDFSIVLGQPLDQELWDQWPVGGKAVAEALRPIIEQLQSRAHSLRPGAP